MEAITKSYDIGPTAEEKVKAYLQMIDDMQLGAFTTLADIPLDTLVISNSSYDIQASRVYKLNNSPTYVIFVIFNYLTYTTLSVASITEDDVINGKKLDRTSISYSGATGWFYLNLITQTTSNTYKHYKYTFLHSTSFSVFQPHEAPVNYNTYYSRGVCIGYLNLDKKNAFLHLSCSQDQYIYYDNSTANLAIGAVTNSTSTYKHTAIVALFNGDLHTNLYQISPLISKYRIITIEGQVYFILYSYTNGNYCMAVKG